MLNLFLN